MQRIIRALIDGRALEHNLARVRELIGSHRRVLAVVKANAYGHGLVPAALALHDADAFAVARLDEGLQLRAAGVRRPIVLLEGVFSAAELKIAAQANLELVVHNDLQLRLLEGQSLGHAFGLWVKVDTGMNRLGFRPEEFSAAWQRVRGLRPVPRALRVMTHLACADLPQHPLTAQQLERFADLTAALGIETSIGNSAGIFAGAASQGDWVRPGLALYGVSPFAGRSGAQLGLKPVMTLEARVIACKAVRAGETVGYGAVWRAESERRIAIIAAGYGDGLPRHLAAGAPVLFAGGTAPLIGRVSMDMIAVDVTDLAGVQVGSVAQLWGPDQPVESLARYADTIPYELLCGVSQRVPVELS
ncbi:MAG: alanine racemase [Steroidobacteraceae bacterium]|nr:alanine racemase [Steroidobacteraceae bacterium]MDW8259977.1 alanine racemase [Gammaproteobacteria bacterium]